MSVLTNIENSVERLAGNIQTVIDDRENMLTEIFSLRGQLMQRDKDAVKNMQDLKAELEDVRMKALYFEQERTRLEAKLRDMNNSLLSLVDNKNAVEAETVE